MFFQVASFLDYLMIESCAGVKKVPSVTKYILVVFIIGSINEVHVPRRKKVMS